MSSEPRRTRDEELLDRLSRAAFTYPEVGATAHDVLPTGYRTVSHSVTLGQGSQVFQHAGASLMAWRMHRGAGVTVLSGAPEAAPGVVAIQFIGRRPFAVSAPCRVVYTIDDEERCGFAYGTLPGHPESGEESFFVRHEDEDRVIFSVRAFSRPATLLSRVGGPVAHVVQDVITRRYLRSLVDIAAGIPS